MRALAVYLGTTVLLIGACGGGSSGGTCDNLACLRTGNDLMLGCATSATCVVEQASTGGGTMCFDNGVKIQASIDIATSGTQSAMTYTYRVKKNESLCYTQSIASIQSWGDGGLAYRMDTTMTDGAGTTVMTASSDQNNVATVTCPGKKPTAYTESCGYPDVTRSPYVSLGSAPPTCTAGTCSF
jgi:hypothetical protein